LSTSNPSTTSLGDKLQWMAMYAPMSLRAVETIADNLIARALKKRRAGDQAD
jgi:hypothetical protein